MSLEARLRRLEERFNALLQALSDYANDGGPAFIDGRWVRDQPGQPTLPRRDFNLRATAEKLKKGKKE